GSDLKIENSGKNLILNNSTDNITLINEGQLISEKDNFTYKYRPNIHTPSYTEWAGKTGYVGFEALYQGATVYGWFKATVLADGSQYTITEYAFYTKPKGAILAGATTLPTTITWSGATDTDWNNANNWIGNTVPTSADDVIIPANATKFPTLTQEVTLNKVTIESGATLITNSKLNANVTYNRNLPTSNWYLVSSPLSNETLTNVIVNNDFASGTAGNIGLAPYKNDGTVWDYQTIDSKGSFVSGKGYSVKLKTADTVKFTGNVNYENVTTPVTVNTNSYNLVGNPYTSYINLKEFFNANPLTTVVKEATVWLWNEATNDYDLKLAGIDDAFQIAPTQGFFVSAAANTNVTFDKNNQSHTAGTFQRQANPKTQVNVTVTSNNGTAKTAKIYYLNEATTGFDNGFDGSVFKGAKSNFSVFTKLVNNENSNDYAVQSLPIADLTTTVVPVGVKATANETIVFSAKSFNLPENTEVYLEDKGNEKFINLSKEKYSVRLKKTTNSGQFFIHTASKNVNDVAKTTNIFISQSAKNELTITGLQSENNTIAIYSTIGKQILSKTFKSNGTTVINLPKVSAGVYIVNLTSDLKKINKKIILN
ncbi:T9SS type A sorting domain-containing protein, partial [Tenacibaculum piscium]